MRLLSWNVAGLRAGPGPAGLGALGGDVICLQETRVTRDLLEEPLAVVEGYNSYFSFCRTRSGYSGVATFCKDSATPLAAEEGLSGLLARPGEGGAVGCYGDHGAFTPQELKALDSEGRAVITHHRIRTSAQQETTLTVINVYCPRADPQRPERAAYQASFYRLLQGRAEALLKDGGHVVILGDINTSHRPIDHCEPGDLEAFREHPGRHWLDGFLWAPDGPPGQGLFVDTFRLLHPNQPYAFTCWRIDTGARLTNHGTRLDYVLADRVLALAELRDARVLPEVPGSDHCPVLAELAATFLAAPRCPPLCTRHMPEFAGTQQTLSRFLVRVERGAGAVAGTGGTCRGAGAGRRCSTGRGRRLPRGQGDLLSYFRAAQGQLRTGTAQNALGHRTEDMAQDALGQSGQEVAHSAPGQDGRLEPCNGMVARELTITARWRAVLPGPVPPPRCPAHGEPCALRTVRKPGPNRGRRFYVCPRPPGRPSDPRARCDFFRWASEGRLPVSYALGEMTPNA